MSILNKGERVLGFDEFIKVKINQFYGIEINDFAVTVAKTALWIAESQMMAETERIVGVGLDFLPLSTNAFIVEGNALRMNWATLKPIDEKLQLFGRSYLLNIKFKLILPIKLLFGIVNLRKRHMSIV